MTPKEARELRTFKNYCNCGGFAYTMNGRNPQDPHMHWCAQRAEWLEWSEAMKKQDKEKA